MEPRCNILVIDDEEDVGEFISASAHTLGLDCVATTDATGLLNRCAPEPALILLDLIMPGMDGIEVLRLLGERKCKARIVLMSGLGKNVLQTAEKLAQSLGLTIVGHLQKPIRLAELEAALNAHSAQKMPVAAEREQRVLFPDDHLRRAIENNQFLLHYQPQIDIKNGSVMGVEALVRWQHPEYGMIGPDDFIARSEKLGLIDELCWTMAERAMAEVSQFTDKDGQAPRLSLNVSVHSLRDLKFPDTFISLIRRHGLHAENVALEITESGLINELSRMLDVLTRLRMKGIQLSIDDFGTGYSMMRQLQNVPATELKIDKLFVMNMDLNNSDRVMVQKTIEIGHDVGMMVVAEGVETPRQLAYLRLKGCDFAQGYLFSRPLPAREMVTWLERNRPLLTL